MRGSRRHRYTRLLRWYPRTWREDHGRVVLDTLEQHAIDQGRSHPSLAESWSLRAHGLGERATYQWAVGFAAIASLAFIATAIALFSSATMLPGAGTVRLLLSVLIGPLALALAGVVLLYRAGRITAPTALCTAVAAVPACGLTAVTAASWTVGFNEANEGMARSWFGSSTLLFLALAGVAGTICLLGPISAALNTRRSAAVRLFQSTLLAVPLALVLGVLVFMSAHMFGMIIAVIVLVVALRAAVANSGRTDVPLPPRTTSTAGTRRQYASVGAAAMVSLVVGIGCLVFALTGSSWASWVRDSTHAMNLGLAAGALAAIPAAVAGGAIFSARWGRAAYGSAFLCCAGLVVVAAAQFHGTGHPRQWPLILVAAVLVGFAIALPFGRLVPVGRLALVAITILFGLAASIGGLFVVTAAGFLAPVAAAVLLAWALLRLSKDRRPGHPGILQH